MSSQAVRITATFAEESELLTALRSVRENGGEVIEVYGPYPLSKADTLLGKRATRLPWICFLLAVAGAAFKIWFQIWTSSVDWALNVGGKPWNSLPAFVPVTFEVMVLVAGLGAFLAFLFRRRLFPGRTPRLPVPGITDSVFAALVRVEGSGEAVPDALRALKRQGAVHLSWFPEDSRP